MAQTIEAPWEHALTRGVSMLSRFPFASVPPEAARKAEDLRSLCHLLRFRKQTGNTLPFIGILGNADSGKSTLFNSVTAASISLVTPIPHQTTGPILAAPSSFEEPALHESLLRPVVNRVELAPAETTGLSGDPMAAKVVPVWKSGDSPIVLIDLPDIGTVDSKEEKQVALRMIPWLDRIILLVTEESFAQADHEEVASSLQALRPERARADLFVVLNRRHSATDDAAFKSRLDKVRDLWPLSTVSTLPHLASGELFPSANTDPLTAEASARASRTLQEALRHLAMDVASGLQALSDERRREQLALEKSIHHEIGSACKFSRAFFSDEFRRRLDAFSPWRMSLKRIRSLLSDEARNEPPVVDLMAVEPVHRHLLKASRKIHRRIERHTERLAKEASVGSKPSIPEPGEEALRLAASHLVEETNRDTRRNVEALLASLQEERKIKDPIWSAVAALSSTVFLVDIIVPSVGTLSSIALSGILSTLGFGGIITSDLMRKLRSTRLRESFETGMRTILLEAANQLLESEPALGFLDLSGQAGELEQWTNTLPEV